MENYENKVYLRRIREEIDSIDIEIINLLRKRLLLALEAKKFKSTVIDPDREREVLRNIIEKNDYLISESFLLDVYERIIKESREIQMKGLKLMGFQGEWGAYGEIASRLYDKSIIPIPCQEFEDVFDGVKSGKFELGIVPIENSLEGIIAPVSSLIIEKDIHIIGEVTIPIHHSLLASKGFRLEEIKEVVSHPQALGQCRNYIVSNGFKARAYYDTAGAAAMIAKNRPAGVAAIANSACSKLYGLEILDNNIEDSPDNMTRFLIISREKTIYGDKCMITFSTKDKVGALSSVLDVFKDHGINLSMIESVPFRKQPGHVWFLVEFWGNESDDKVKGALERVKKFVSELRVIGNYRGWDK